MLVLDEYTSTSGSWVWVCNGHGMNITVSLNVFINAFHVLFPTWRVKVLIKISIYLTAPDLAVYPQISG